MEGGAYIVKKSTINKRGGESQIKFSAIIKYSLIELEECITSRSNKKGGFLNEKGNHL